MSAADPTKTPEYERAIVLPVVRDLGMTVKEIYDLSKKTDEIDTTIAAWWEHSTFLVDGNEELGFDYTLRGNARPPIAYRIEHTPARARANSQLAMIALGVKIPFKDPRQPDTVSTANVNFSWELKTNKEQMTHEYPKDTPKKLLDVFTEDLVGLHGLIVARRKEVISQQNLIAAHEKARIIIESKYSQQASSQPSADADFSGVITEPENSELIG